MSKLDWIINTSVGDRDAVAPHIVCTDGTILSVQASEFHYCTPRTDFAPWSEVEVMLVTEDAPPPDWEKYRDVGPNVFAWVPVDLVREFIEEHGGEEP